MSYLGKSLFSVLFAISAYHAWAKDIPRADGPRLFCALGIGKSVGLHFSSYTSGASVDDLTLSKEERIKKDEARRLQPSYYASYEPIFTKEIDESITNEMEALFSLPKEPKSEAEFKNIRQAYARAYMNMETSAFKHKKGKTAFSSCQKRAATLGKKCLEIKNGIPNYDNCGEKFFEEISTLISVELNKP